MQNMYSFFNPQYHREQMMNAYNQYMNALYPQQQTQMQATLPQGYSIFPVSNIEEANATKADLNYNPTFFFNQSKGEIYLKQLDRSTNAATLRIFKEVQTAQEPLNPVNSSSSVNDYTPQLNTILEGINGLYRLLAPQQDTQKIIEAEISELKSKGGKNAK
jgi:hypothetical protein